MAINFDEIGDKLKKLSQGAVSEVQKVNDLYSVNNKISKIKKSMTDAYAALGEKVFEEAQGEVPAGCDEMFAQISLLKGQLTELEDEVIKLKGKQVCPSCGKDILDGAKFCTHCGVPIPQKAEEEEESTVDAEDVKDAAADAVDSVKDAAADAADKTQDAVADVKDKAADVADDMKDKAADVADDVKDKAEDIAEKLKDAAEKAKEEVKKTFE